MNLLFLTFLFPLAGYLILAFGRARISENAAAIIGVGSVLLSATTTLWVGCQFFLNPPAGGFYTEHLWNWIPVAGFSSELALRLDGLSLTMLGVVTGVGFLIHLFASWYMRGEEGYSRFFSYMNLFIVAMLFLVLGDNLLFVYFGWEGVGLCSYLLIGFYYKDPANGLAARKAFIVTRIGDTFMAIGMFVLFWQLGTLNIQDMLVEAPKVWQPGAPMAAFAALMLLGGAVGKSAQLPLQTWLPDAMAGPTPVSALIHAATMVTAGVYLIARTHGLFELAPAVLQLTGEIGAITLVLAGFAALVQTDIKRVLAYSTMSQIGYMFLALGAGAWQAAIFHLMSHAFFKALLFLTSGAVILACHHEQDIFKMGGLWKKLPLEYACFLVGGAALSALPFVTIGYYSKDAILEQALLHGHPGLVAAGVFGALMTGLYTFRMIFIVFHGKPQGEVHAGHGVAWGLPLVVLLVLSTAIGALIHPPTGAVLPAALEAAGSPQVKVLGYIAAAASVSGILLAALLYLGRRRLVDAVAVSLPGRALTGLWKNAWGFDWFYDWLLVKSFQGLVYLLRGDLFDKIIGLIPRLMGIGNRLLGYTQNGQLRWYAATVGAGAAILLFFIIL